MTVPHLHPAPSGFRHEAWFYDGDRRFVEATLPFLREAAALDEPVLVAVGPHKIRRLRTALGEDAGHVRFIDIEALGANPARIIPAWQDFVDEHGGTDRPLRGIGEPCWPGRTPPERSECHRHEALLNVAFRDVKNFHLVCPYDTEGLGAADVTRARGTHPVVVEGGVERPSIDYRAVDEGTPFAEPLPEPGTTALEMPFGAEHLNTVRRHVLAHGRRAGLDVLRAEELQLAVSELAANSVRHGGGDGVLRVWTEPDRVVCEVRDAGRIIDPLVGRRRPGLDQIGGFGLWISNQLCDLVQIRTFADGTTVRVHLRRPEAGVALSPESPAAEATP